MLSLGSLFWLMILFFAIIGSLRGWTREVIATSGLILSLFAINQFGNLFLGFVPTGSTIPPDRQRFYYLAILHLLIAFFSYQGPAFAGSRFGERLRVRDTFQDKLLGLIVGALNGYLIIGSLWSFLEYRIQAAGEWLQLPPGEPYPFDFTVLTRPDVAGELGALMGRLPLPLLEPYLPFLVVIVFLFVIIVMI
ncbi:CvpA family protein [Candidatus Leptofilum sp.]|uniref:CvpA family protein n=1 Tax=Candidatus Leptofilum sp. TaxID=3241576 RepID=UPI003B592D0A